MSTRPKKHTLQAKKIENERCTKTPSSLLAEKKTPCNHKQCHAKKSPIAMQKKTVGTRRGVELGSLASSLDALTS
jgi:hypothetical protein